MNAMIILLMLPLSFLFSPSMNTSSANRDPSFVKAYLPKTVEIEIEVTFGRKKKGCSGLGICDIGASGGTREVLAGNKAVATATATDGIINNLYFSRVLVNNENISEYLSGSHFMVGENFSGAFTLGGQKYTLNLKAGKYPIQKSEQGFNIGMPPTLR